MATAAPLQDPLVANILVVDDYPPNLTALEGLLEPLGQRVVRARSGQEAIKHVIAEDFAAILMDVQMPIMDGIETAELIRRRQRSQHTPILFLTAIYKDPAHIFKGYATGAVDYLVKPVDPEVLRAKVRVFVDLYLSNERVRRQQDLLREQERTLLLQKLDGERLRQLETANRARDEFLAVLSHELRTPLHAILGWTEMLRAGRLVEAQKEAALESIHRNARAQARLVEDLLDTSRVLGGSLALELRPLAIEGPILAALETARVASQERGVRLQVHNAAGGAVVRGEPLRLQQVIWNLLSNAIKFTPPGKTVTLSTRLVEGVVEVCVADEGEGIAPTQIVHVFERYWGKDSSKARSRTGLGLGLAIVKDLVTMHGGTVRAESDGVGKGAAFTVELPLAAVTTETPAEAPRPHLVGAPLSGVRVLVVDDEPDARELLAIVLQEAGAEVVSAGSAADAFPLVKEWKPHALLSDLGLPGEDGHSFLRRVRALAGVDGGGVPAIALTAYSGAQEAKAAQEAGFQAHLAKPVDPPTVVDAVVKLLGPRG